MSWRPMFLLAMALLPAVVTACGRAAEESAAGGPADKVVPSVMPKFGGGGGPPLYDEPVPVVPGSYVSPAGTTGAYQRGLAAAAEERQKPRFEGSINGFRLYGFERAAADPLVGKQVCAGGEIVEFRVVDRLRFGYLPPGTAAFGPQSAAMCGDGSVASFGQQFVAFNATFDIWYEAGERALAHDASAERVSPGAVRGRPAVLIRPLTEEGFGRSWVAFATGNGVVIVDARDLPFGEVVKVAEGVTCADC